MIFYEAICFCCKKAFRIYEGTEKYKRYKKNRKGLYSCDDCSRRIQMEAMTRF